MNLRICQLRVILLVVIAERFGFKFNNELIILKRTHEINSLPERTNIGLCIFYSLKLAVNLHNLGIILQLSYNNITERLRVMTVARREHGNRQIRLLRSENAPQLNRRDHQTVQNLSFSGARLLSAGTAATASVPLLQHTGVQC
jgi:hypothetical protein